MPLLNHLLHRLLRLLDIIRPHLPVSLVLPDQLVVLLSCSLDARVCLLGRLPRILDGLAAGVACWGRERDLDGEGVGLLGRERGEGVWRGGYGGGDGFDVLWVVSFEAFQTFFTSSHLLYRLRR